MFHRRLAVALPILVLLMCGRGTASAPEPSGPARPLILAHYMPWYVAKPVSQLWGWHWTMNHFDPDRIDNGKRAIASHFYPLIEPYDSADPHVIEYHLLLMKLAGIDGVIVDWYGLQDFRDYSILHRNTQKMVEQVERLGMKFVICYEDQTIPALVEAGRLQGDNRVSHARSEIEWLAEHWFKMKSYVQLDGRAVLLSFGHAGLSDDEWSECLAGLRPQVAYFSEHYRRNGAVGGFDWPVPKRGLRGIEQFQAASKGWPHAIPVAFPRFFDIYAEAKVRESYGRIDDADGETFRTSLSLAVATKQRLIQIATWNDWGEGTAIEPSREFGYRDLEVLQRMRREDKDSPLTFEPQDLRLPHELLELRRMTTQSDKQQRLNEIADMIAAGDVSSARRQLLNLANSESK